MDFPNLEGVMRELPFICVFVWYVIHRGRTDAHQRAQEAEVWRQFLKDQGRRQEAAMRVVSENLDSTQRSLTKVSDHLIELRMAVKK